MISNITKGSSFSGLMVYLTRDDKNHELLGETMASFSDKEQVAIMNAVASQRPRLKKNVFHASISLEPGKRLNKQDWIDIGHKYMEHMGFSNSPYCIIKHNDTPNREHIHCEASRVDYDGNVVPDSHDWAKSMEFMRWLELEYDTESVITPEIYSDREKKLKTINEQVLENKVNVCFTTKDGTKTQSFKKYIKDSVKEAQSYAIQKSESTNEAYQEFTSALLDKGIELEAYKKKDGRIYGLTYNYDGHIIKASTIGKAYGPLHFERLLKNKLDHKEQMEAVINKVKLSIKKVSESRYETFEQMQKAFKKKCFHEGLKITECQSARDYNRVEYIYELKGKRYQESFHHQLPSKSKIDEILKNRLIIKKPINNQKNNTQTSQNIQSKPLLAKIHGPKKKSNEEEPEQETKKSTGMSM